MKTTQRILNTAIICLFFGAAPTRILAQLTDFDLDGFPDEMEELIGTDAQDSESRPSLADNHHIITAHWPLRVDAREVIAGELNGTLLGGAEFRNDAVRLDGRDAYVDFGNSSVLSSSNGIAWSVWVRPTKHYGLSRVLGKFADNDREYACFLLGGRVWAYFSDNGTSRRGHSLLAATKCMTVKRGEWTHITVSWQADGLIDIYVNGTQKQAWNTGHRLLSSLYTGTAPLTLGAYDVRQGQAGRRGLSRGSFRNTFDGDMTALSLFNDALSASEVKELFLLGRDGSLTDYIALDSDRDGLPDWWERLFFDDLAQDAEADFDGDGLTNAEELARGLDPRIPDNPDGDPTYDSDGDGFTDAEEEALGMNPFAPCARVSSDVLGLKLFIPWVIQ